MATPLPDLGSMVECKEASVGGARGVFAKVSLSPGTVLYSEKPLMEASESDFLANETWHTCVARRIIESPDAPALLKQLDLLHPNNLSNLSSHALAEIRQKFDSVADYLTRFGKTSLSKDEALTILLKVRMNALANGLFCILSLINHACFPNATVLTTARQLANGKEICVRSDVVATCKIEAGGEIYFAYHGTLERSSKARAILFRRQHFVDLIPSKLPYAELEAFTQKDELVTPIMLDIEADLDRTEMGLDHTAATKPSATKRQQMSEQRMAELEAILARASEYLHPRHLVLCRIRRLWSKAARDLLAISPDTEVAERLVHFSQEVRATQSLFLPATHLQVAETADDLAGGISVLLANDRPRLFRAFPETCGTLSNAASTLRAFESESNDIRKLYASLDLRDSCSREVPEKASPDDAKKARTSGDKDIGGVPEDWSIFD